MSHDLNKIRVWRELDKKNLKIAVVALAIIGVALIWHGNSEYNNVESNSWRNYYSSRNQPGLGDVPGVQWVAAGGVVLAISAVLLWDLLFVHKKEVPPSLAL